MNMAFQYIDLYVSNISRLLVILIVTERQACGPYGFENYVDMTETHLRSITNSGTWMLILDPTYYTKIFIGQTT